MAFKVHQSVTTRAKNPNAKYKVKYSYKQQGTISNNKFTTLKYTYSKLVNNLVVKKYSYAV